MQVEFNGEAKAAIEKMAALRGKTAVEILGEAVAVYLNIVEADARGGKILIENYKGDQVKLVWE